MERRETPLAHVSEVEDYNFAVQVINRVGWVTGDKKATPTFKRDRADGTYILNEDSDMILDSDFETVLHAIRSSDAVEDFNWLTKSIDGYEGVVDPAEEAWSVNSLDAIADPFYTLDAKRLSRKYTEVVTAISAVPHFSFREVFDVIAESPRSDVTANADYLYVEIQNVETGTFRSEPLKGWELPARARHKARTGDFFVGGVWGSVRKWMLVGKLSDDLRVTNGMHRLRLKTEHEEKRLDIVAGLCSEAYSVQMRALARGSDGLAEINADDLLDVVLPLVEDLNVRVELHPFVIQLMHGYTSVESKVAALISEDRLALPDVPKRGNHVMIV